ncbi:MAG: response regulator [Bacteroidota bacterium]
MKKILIIEDDPIFGDKLRKRLTQVGYLAELWTKCNSESELHAINRDFDLLLLDLNLGENSNIHGEGILEILRETFSAPIIVMTAHDDRIINLLKTNAYTVLRKPIDIDLLIHHIQNALRYSDLNTKLAVSSSKVDFAIVTALFESEFENLIDVFDLKLSDHLRLSSKNIYEGTLRNFPEKKVIAIYQSEVGRIDAGNTVTDIIKEYNPKYIFMTGVCGGSPETNIGDVIIAKFVFTFDKGKITDEGFLREIELVKTNEELIRIVRENNKKITATMKSAIKKAKKKEFKSFDAEAIKAIIDPMACSAQVIDKENYFSEIISKIDRKATAVEMESYGFARAAESTNSGATKFLVIKSVMDKTTGKEDFAKPYASFTSAVYLKTLLELGILN